MRRDSRGRRVIALAPAHECLFNLVSATIPISLGLVLAYLLVCHGLATWSILTADFGYPLLWYGAACFWLGNTVGAWSFERAFRELRAYGWVQWKHGSLKRRKLTSRNMAEAIEEDADL